MDTTANAGATADRRTSQRRAGGRGGRRRHDKGLPWWRTGMWFAALCVALRGRRWLRR